MKRKSILCLTFALSLSAADAAGRTIIDQTGWLRERLGVSRTDAISALKSQYPASGVPRPKDNDYDILVWDLREIKGMPKSALNVEILAAAEDSNARLKQGVEYWEQGGWNRKCMDMLRLMRLSKDRDFLPFIEKAGTESADWRVRVEAVESHVAICGFESFPFVKRAMAAAMSPSTQRERGCRYYIIDAFLNPRWESPPMPEGHIAEVCRWLLEQIGTVNDILLLELYDGYLLKHLPEYAHSRQRLALASREDLDETDCGGNRRENLVIAIKAHFDAIPPSERTDLRIRYPDLPPLPDDPAEADASVPRAWLITAVGVAALAAALVLLRKRTRHQSFRQKGQP